MGISSGNYRLLFIQFDKQTFFYPVSEFYLVASLCAFNERQKKVDILREIMLTNNMMESQVCYVKI